MDLTQISLQTADPEHYFEAVTSLMNIQDTEPNTAESLAEWYKKQVDNDVRFKVLVTELGEVLGFCGIYRSYTNLEQNYSINNLSVTGGFLLNRNSDFNNKIDIFPGIDLSYRTFDNKVKLFSSINKSFFTKYENCSLSIPINFICSSEIPFG